MAKLLEHTDYPSINKLIHSGRIRRTVEADFVGFYNSNDELLFHATIDQPKSLLVGEPGKETFQYVPVKERDEEYKAKISQGPAHESVFIAYSKAHSGLSIYQQMGRESLSVREFHFGLAAADKRYPFSSIINAVTILGAPLLTGEISKYLTNNLDELTSTAIFFTTSLLTLGLTLAVLPLRGIETETAESYSNLLGIGVTSAQASILKADSLVRGVAKPSTYSFCNVTGINCALHDIEALDAVGVKKEQFRTYDNWAGIASPGNMRRFANNLSANVEPVTITIKKDGDKDVVLKVKSAAKEGRDYSYIEVEDAKAIPYGTEKIMEVLGNAGIRFIGGQPYKEGEKLKAGTRLEINTDIKPDHPPQARFFGSMVSSSVSVRSASPQR